MRMDVVLARRADQAAQKLPGLGGGDWVPELCPAGKHNATGQAWHIGASLPGGGEWEVCGYCGGQLRVWSPGAPGGSCPLSDAELVARWEELLKKKKP